MQPSAQQCNAPLPLRLPPPLLALHREVLNFAKALLLRYCYKKFVRGKDMKHKYFENNLFTPLFFAELMSKHSGKNIKIHEITPLNTPKNTEISQVKHPDNVNHPIGIFKYRLQFEIDNQFMTEDVVIKSKVSDKDYLKNISHLFQTQLGVHTQQPLENYLGQLNFSNINKREILAYQLQKSNPALTAVMPEILGYDDDPTNNSSILILKAFNEDYSASNHIDYQQWNNEAIHAVIDAIGTFHHCWYDRLTEIESFSILRHVDSRTYLKLNPLWQALSEALETHIGGLISKEDHGLYEHWVSTINEWYPLIDTSPKTLIHNDFAPKNIAVKFSSPSHAILLDWELPIIHLPQRDVIEFLAYVLPEKHDSATLFNLLKRHMLLVSNQHDEKTWLKQTKAALLDYCVQRISLCILIEKVEPRNIKKVFATVKRMLTHLNHYLGET